jgi:multisubunit Na+/H+ antiporter MnhE subunit
MIDIGAFFSSGHAADLVLFFIAIEGVWLIVRQRQSGRGLNTQQIILGLLPGFCLVLALRVALVGGWWGWIGVALIVSLVAHLLDMRERIQL